MRPVYVVSGGVSKFAKARPDKTFQAIVKEAYDYAIHDLGLDFATFTHLVDGSVASYFSDHFTRQLMAGIMAQDYLGLCPKPGHRVEGGGATGGICFQEAWKSVASGLMDICVAYGFETMSHVETWKGNEFIALASDVSFDYPVGGFYSGYYAMMVTRHMKEFGTTVEQMASVSVKNHLNAYHNPYAQKRNRYTIADVRNAPMVAWPLTRLDICVMSDGAAATILVSEEGLRKLEAAGAHIARPLVSVTGIGRGTDAMRMADRPHVDYDDFMHNYATEQERSSDETRAYYRRLWDHGTRYPGVHSFRAGRTAGNLAYKQAGITRSAARAGLRGAARCLHLQRDPDLRRYGAVPLWRGRSLCRLWQGLYARHRLRPGFERRTRVRRQSLRRADRLRSPGRGHRPDAGCLCPLAAAGLDRQALRR